MDIAELIHLAIAESEALEDLIGTRYGPSLPQGTDRPYVRWEAEGAVPESQSGALRVARVSFECVADTYTGASEVADAVAGVAEFTAPVVGTTGTVIAGAVTGRTMAHERPGESDLGYAIATVAALWWVSPA